MSNKSPVRLGPVLDPFTKLGDEVTGDTPDQIAINLGECCKLSRRFHQRLQYEPPALRQIFRGIKLSEPAKAALRRAEGIMQAAEYAHSS